MADHDGFFRTAERILDDLEAAYAREASQDEIDALWARWHEKERAMHWLLDGYERVERTVDRLAAKKGADRG